MKNILKVTFGTMLAISIIAPVQAGTDGFIDGLAIYGAATYTKPSNNGLSVGDLLVGQPAPGPGDFDGYRRATFLNPNNEWEYFVGFTFSFDCDSYLYLNYDRFQGTDSKGDTDIRNIGLQPTTVFIAPPFLATAGTALIEEHSNEWTLGLAHKIHFPGHFHVDMLAFLERDSLDLTLHETNKQLTAGGLVIHNRITDNDVHMFGPGVGVMTQVYPICAYRQWGFFAGGTTAIMYAKSDYNQTYFADDDTFYIYDPEESHSLITKLDISFGVNYHCRLNLDLKGAMFDIALGMRYMNMFNVLKNGNAAYNPVTQSPTSGTADTIDSFAANTGWPQDWGRFGPFLRFKIGGHDAA